MKRFLLTSTALIFALQTGVADAEEMVVRQAQLIDFARPLPQKENIPAVENDMRNQFAAIAPEEMNRDPARLRLELGRASCRDRVCQYVKYSVGAVTRNKKKKEK